MKISDVEIGEIYHLFCEQLNPPKNKFHVFLGDGYFLLINSRYWCESVELTAEDYPFLNHNSHLYCGGLHRKAREAKYGLKLTRKGKGSKPSHYKRFKNKV
jgi:hypothetical protein